jgi:hypothetical protein
VSTLDIQCPCGHVGVELRGEPLGHLYCHCDDCQAVHGAAYVPVAVYPADAVTVTRGEPIVWARKTAQRFTCLRCGARLFAAPEGNRVRGVTAYLLPEGHFKPMAHIYCQFALLPIKDDLPHYKTVPARWGGSDETTEW